MSSTGQNLKDWRLLLTAAERAVMLEDIARVSLTAGAEGFPEQPWAGLGVTPQAEAAPKSPVEQLGFIEHLLPALAQDVSQISRSPLFAAAPCGQAAFPERARRVQTASWMAYARQGGAQRTLEETKTALSYNTPENRAVKSFLGRLRRDCQTIAHAAEAAEEAGALERALHCKRQVSRMGTETWWQEVTPRSGDWAQPLPQRGSFRPDYAGVSLAGYRYRTGFSFEWDHPLLLLPPRETWRLYEMWCLFTVLRALHELGWHQPAPESFAGFFAVREGRLLLSLAIGEKSRLCLRSPQGRTISLTYNQAFAEGRESLSHTMRPDIALSDGKRVWLLDAKFKPYSEPGEEGDDVNQMHAYRDAIIGVGGRNVACAWCLYAGLTGPQANRSHLTYGRGAGAPVGALCLRPGSAETFTALRDLLRRWLAAG